MPGVRRAASRGPGESVRDEAEERGEEVKARPKVAAANLTVIRWSSPTWGSNGIRMVAVEIDVSNTGAFAVDDIGLTCYYRKPGDDPRDDPFYATSDATYFAVLKPGETVRVRFGFSDLQFMDIMGESIRCDPWFLRVNTASAPKVGGREDLDLSTLVEGVVTTSTPPVRERRQDWTTR